MNKLSNDIYAYYVAHFDDLPFEKQLHLASRLYLWADDTFGAEQLAKLRPEVTAQGDVEAALRAVYDYGQTSIHHGSKNAAVLRAPYFEKYPQLRTLALVLFRLTFLETIYGLDARKYLFELFDKAEIESLLSSLTADTEAVALLSTHAINVLYLYHRVVLGDDVTLAPEQFLAIGHDRYDFGNPVHLQLFIYLYTHCIIGESKFYARATPDRYRSVYETMLDELETRISDQFNMINLDNKFEFLVCCKLLGRTSALTSSIFDEAKHSVSDQGTYLVDRHNRNPQSVNASLELSEHRNVLYLLANRPFGPGAQSL